MRSTCHTAELPEVVDHIQEKDIDGCFCFFGLWSVTFLVVPETRYWPSVAKEESRASHLNVGMLSLHIGEKFDL